MDLPAGSSRPCSPSPSTAPSTRPPGRCTSRRRRSASGSARSRRPSARWWCSGRPRAGRRRPARCCCGWPGSTGCSARRRGPRSTTRVAADRACAVAVNADSLATWFRRRGRPRSPAGTASRCGSTSRTRRSPPTCCARRGAGRRDLRPDAGAGLPGRAPSARCATGRPRHRRSPSAGGAAAATTGQRMPVVRFNEKDDLQHDLLAARGLGDPPVVHRVPTSADFHEAVRRGLGLGPAARAPAAAGPARRQPGDAQRRRPRRRAAALDALAAGLTRAHPAR